MKNLVYVSAIAFMGLVACGAPADQKEAATEEAVDTVEVSVETVEMDSTAAEVDSTTTEEEVTE
mgnify:FL=1